MSDDNRSMFARLAHTLRRAARDVALIVLSILIAFALDAWWDSRSDRQEEARLLADLHREFSAIKREFNSVQSYHREKVAAARALQALAGRPAPRDSVIELWRRSLGTRTFDPPRGTAESIIMSGKLGLIRDGTLARLLAGWTSRVENMSKAEENLRTVYRDEILPWLQDRTPMPHAAPPGAGFEPNLDVIARDYRFTNRLGWTIAQAELILDESEPVAATIDSILQRTDRK